MLISFLKIKLRVNKHLFEIIYFVFRKNWRSTTRRLSSLKPVTIYLFLRRTSFSPLRSYGLLPYTQSRNYIWLLEVWIWSRIILWSINLNVWGVDLKSHNSLKFFVRFAIKHAELSDDIFWHLHDSWTKAEK